MSINKSILTITALLAILKIEGTLTMSWWLITILVWLPPVIIGTGFILVMVIAFLIEKDKLDKKKRGRR